MSTIIIYTILTLGLIGVLSAIVLYFVAQKFKVFEDPLIVEVENILPAANCGGCGFPSCHSFAVACVNAKILDDLFCTVGGNSTMKKVAALVEKETAEKPSTVAVVRCGGSCETRPRTNQYDGVNSCAVEHNLYGGETGCSWGCLGLGDCVVSCKFDAIHINSETQLPEIIENRCTSCGACVKACPKFLIELRNVSSKSERIYVNCLNKEKGSIAQRYCKVACISCSKCEKECAFDAITITNNLAFIDSKKCTLCRKCATVCPTNAIVEINFPLS